MKTKDQAAREAISIVSLFLEDLMSKEYPEQSSWDVWVFVANVLKKNPDTTLVSRLKKDPTNSEIQEKALEFLEKHLEDNPEELVRLSGILERTDSEHILFEKFSETSQEELGDKSHEKSAKKIYNGRFKSFEESRKEEEFSRFRPSGRMSYPGSPPPSQTHERGETGVDRTSETSQDLFSEEKDGAFEEEAEGMAGLGAKFDEEPEPERARILQKPSARAVNTGFSSWDDPDKVLFKKLPLATGKEYLFCIDIGPIWEDTIETDIVDIQVLPEKDATLSVVVFGFPRGIQVTPGADRGEFRISGGNPARVLSQPISEKSRQPSSEQLKTCLFFPVTMPVEPPESEGVARMRCNIYWRNILLQSRLVSARVVEDPAKFVKTRQKQIKSYLDYSLSGTLSPVLVNQLQPHSMSLLFNSNGDTQSIFIEGGDRPQHVAFEGGEIQDFIENVRINLRLISWGSKNEWDGKPYLYRDGEPNLDRLKRDLVYLAKWGYNFYFTTYQGLEGGKQGKDSFEEQLKKPGYIHIATRRSPNHLIPAAMIYDYPLNTRKNHAEYDICPEFLNAYNEGLRLEDTPCFRGDCPTRKRMKELAESHQEHLCTTVCPSGFWGFRHFLGLPISLDHAEGQPDIPSSIPLGDKMIFSSCIYTDMSLLKKHETALKNLKALVPSVEWQYADEDEELTPILLLAKPHIIYFYCHGDLVNGTLQLRIGSKEKSCFIDPTVLKYIIWENPRPLVFLNGCRTAGISPNQLINFIKPLVTHSNGAGVIGTEITIFEELATEFSERFFEQFLDGKPVGDAIRHARLALLGQGNPLGLAYTPYVIPTLRLMKSEN